MAVYAAPGKDVLSEYAYQVLNILHSQCLKTVGSSGLLSDKSFQGKLAFVDRRGVWGSTPLAQKSYSAALYVFMQCPTLSSCMWKYRRASCQASAVTESHVAHLLPLT
jgi:hypothetical protein